MMLLQKKTMLHLLYFIIASLTICVPRTTTYGIHLCTSRVLLAVSPSSSARCSISATKGVTVNTNNICIPIRPGVHDQRRQNYRSLKQLYSGRKNEENGDDSSIDDRNIATKDDSKSSPLHQQNRWQNIDANLIYTDVFAILIACQLMGLIDVLNDPSFYINGGWIQPIQLIDTTTTPSSLSSLPLLMQRVTSNTITYVFVALFAVQDYYHSDTFLASTKTMLQKIISSILLFTFVRLIVLGIGFQLSLMTQNISIEQQQQLPLLLNTITNVVKDSFNLNDMSYKLAELLRESYILAVTVTAGRLTLYKIFRGD